MNLDHATPFDPANDAIEMNHRIANNLAMLASLVRLDGLGVLDPDARVVLETTRRRIHAIAGVHRRLYRSGRLDGVDLGAFLTELGDDLRTICEDTGRRRRLVVEAASMTVTPRDAAAIGVLVAELVGSACKYAYAQHEAGEIRVLQALSPSGAWSLTVEDDGRGFGERDQDLGRSGVGSALVSSVMDRLDAHYVWENAHPGTRFVMWAERPIRQIARAEDARHSAFA